jgi:hypothetical protein
MQSMPSEHMVTVPLKQGQYDALADWVFNLGEGRLQMSTLLKVLNAGSYGSVPAQLMKWAYGGGVKLPGLVTRREAEVKLFTGALAIWNKKGSHWGMIPVAFSALGNALVCVDTLVSLVSMVSKTDPKQAKIHEKGVFSGIRALPVSVE